MEREHLPFSSPGDREERPNSPAGSSVQTPDEKENNFGELCTGKTAFGEQRVKCRTFACPVLNNTASTGPCITEIEGPVKQQTAGNPS